MMMLGWVANGPQQLSGVTHTCNTTTVGRVCAIFSSLSRLACGHCSIQYSLVCDNHMLAIGINLHKYSRLSICLCVAKCIVAK